MSYGENKVVVAPDCGIFDARPEMQNGGKVGAASAEKPWDRRESSQNWSAQMSENRCQCGGLRHKHDIERVSVLESSIAQAQADVEALRRVDETAEALILSIGYPKNRLLVARYMSAKGALPEHLRGAKR